MTSPRINIIFILCILFGAVLIGRLFFIQVRQGDFYKALAQGIQSIYQEQEGERGEISFRSGELLAINRDWPLVFVSPEEMEDKEGAAEALADILGLEKDYLLTKFQENNIYLAVKKKISPEEEELMKGLELKGVYLSKETGRYYPQETLASQVIGFLGAGGKGQYGLEEYYDKVLQGENGKKGSDLILTIDYSIQFTAEKLLARVKEELEIERGEIIVLEPDSGKILALANFPNFNPNQYSEVTDFDIFQNGASQKLFEPGSVFKPVTMASAMEEEKITPQTTYFDQGSVKFSGSTIYNYDERVYGEQTMIEVLEKSINTGAVYAESQLGHNLFLKYVEELGVFSPSGIDLQENYSENLELKKGYEINFATASFGQGIEMTSVQLVRAYATLINGGRLIRPYLVEKLVEGGEVREVSTEVQAEQVLSQKTVSQLAAMLVSVVENGFGRAARIPGYYVGGKTGTAQIAFAALGQNKKGYSDKTWQTFIGFAPAFDPKFLIMVKLKNPQTKTAEYSAVPIFRELAGYIIDYEQIPPDYQ